MIRIILFLALIAALAASRKFANEAMTALATAK